MRSTRANTELAPTIRLTHPDDQPFLLAFALFRPHDFKLRILKLLVLLQVVRPCRQFIGTCLVPNNQAFIASRHILVMERLEFSRRRRLLCRQKLNVSELVFGEECLESSQTL